MTVKQARARMRQAFKADPDFRRVYVDNVACVIMDRIPGFKRNKSKRDAIADEIVHLIFD